MPQHATTEDYALSCTTCGTLTYDHEDAEEIKEEHLLDHPEHVLRESHVRLLKSFSAGLDSDLSAHTKHNRLVL